jgi:hypothetical protein
LNFLYKNVISFQPNLYKLLHWNFPTPVLSDSLNQLVKYISIKLTSNLKIINLRSFLIILENYEKSMKFYLFLWEIAILCCRGRSRFGYRKQVDLNGRWRTEILVLKVRIFVVATTFNFKYIIYFKLFQLSLWKYICIFFLLFNILLWLLWFLDFLILHSILFTFYILFLISLFSFLLLFS